jgi:hypothetical protein
MKEANRMSLAEKVDRAIALDKSIKEQKKELDKIKADLQASAMEDMENKNIKHVQLFGTQGQFEALYKEKLEIDHYRLLVRLLGDIVRDKVTRKVEVKFDIEARFKAALMTLLKGDYKLHDLDGILAGMGLDAKAMKTAKKKLKGDYKADKKTLEALKVTGEREEELDAIREVKNLELVQRYFDLATIDLELLKKALWLEESLSAGIVYDTDGAS